MLRQTRRMSIAITGASGMIGTALAESLCGDGVDVVRLVRREAIAPDEVAWDPAAGWVDLAALQPREVTGILNLAGAGIGDHRWTKRYKRRILGSRIRATETISAAVVRLEPMPTLISGSAIGYYGATGPSPVDESGPNGAGFLAGVCRDWETATAEAQRSGARVVLARTGLVVSARGGAFEKLIRLTRLGLGGRLGTGRQLWSFIALTDEVAALRFCLDHPLEGPVNLVAPMPVTNADAVRELARLLHRPAKLPVPSFALRAALGEFATDVLASQPVVPSKLTAAGFQWRCPAIGDALAAALADAPRQGRRAV